MLVWTRFRDLDVWLLRLALIPYDKVMFNAEVKPVTRFVAVVALILADGFCIPIAIIAIKTAAAILRNARKWAQSLHSQSFGA